MSEDPPSSDSSLLERLNALKATNITLDNSTEITPADTIDRVKPPSREDALSDRLKSLRNQVDSTGSPPLKADTPGSVAKDTPSETRSMKCPPSSDLQPSAKPLGGAVTKYPKEAGVSNENDQDADVDPLLETDDQTLEELLADLESDEQWVEQVAAEEEEHRKAMALLEELSLSPKKDGPTGSRSGDKGGDEPTDEGNSSEDDNSDGEEMTRKADNIMSQVMDEVEWEKKHAPPHESDASLRDVSSADSPDATKSSTTTTEDPFQLPTVPTNLSDPRPRASQDDTDFATSIASRMAALKVTAPSGGAGSPSLPSVPTSEPDPFGLPTAPKFAPRDRPVKGVLKRPGYTDEDQKTWCTVCLEDGAILCIDCDRDMYCARCWKEMHVGAQAYYDYRGHRWEKVNPRDR